MSKINLKLAIGFFIFLFCIMDISAQRRVDTYSLSYFDRVYDILASTEIRNGRFRVFIEVSAQRESTRATIDVENTEMAGLIRFLVDMRDRYVEWSEIATANNVTELSRRMDFRSPPVTVSWLGAGSSEWRFAFRERLQPRFLILNDGRHVVVIVQEVQSSSNRFIRETIYWVFSDAQEIDELIARLDVERIAKKIQEAQNINELFR